MSPSAQDDLSLTFSHDTNHNNTTFNPQILDGPNSFAHPAARRVLMGDRSSGGGAVTVARSRTMPTQRNLVGWGRKGGIGIHWKGGISREKENKEKSVERDENGGERDIGRGIGSLTKGLSIIQKRSSSARPLGNTTAAITTTVTPALAATANESTPVILPHNTSLVPSQNSNFYGSTSSGLDQFKQSTTLTTTIFAKTDVMTVPTGTIPDLPQMPAASTLVQNDLAPTTGSHPTPEGIVVIGVVNEQGIANDGKIAPISPMTTTITTSAAQSKALVSGSLIGITGSSESASAGLVSSIDMDAGVLVTPAIVATTTSNSNEVIEKKHSLTLKSIMTPGPVELAENFSTKIASKTVEALPAIPKDSPVGQRTIPEASLFVSTISTSLSGSNLITSDGDLTTHTDGTTITLISDTVDPNVSESLRLTEGIPSA